MDDNAPNDELWNEIDASKRALRRLIHTPPNFAALYVELAHLKERVAALEAKHEEEDERLAS
jgi:hypothetical protein